MSFGQDLHRVVGARAREVAFVSVTTQNFFFIAINAAHFRKMVADIVPPCLSFSYRPFERHPNVTDKLSLGVDFAILTEFGARALNTFPTVHRESESVSPKSITHFGRVQPAQNTSRFLDSWGPIDEQKTA